MISVSTLVGFSTVVGLFIYSVKTSTTNYFIFLNIPSLSLVLGGTFAATFVSYGARNVFIAMGDVFSLFLPSKYNQKALRKDIARFMEWNRMLRSQGITAIEESLTKAEQKDNIITHGIELLSSGYDSKNINYMLSLTAQNRFQEMKRRINILNSLTSFAPAFGMVGTIVGLVVMLDHLEGDIGALGQGLALALITTLYGIMLAQMFFKPAATQLNQRLMLSSYRDKLIIEGFSVLPLKLETMMVQDRLNSLLNSELHYQTETETEKKG
ncbi:MAG: MotA/TolQ/ExbB proton channel family protein [Legionellales bacterium]|nr:MotA/TolQ/ExbB proton channel family protein [Legionellales bacterium]